MLQFYNYSLQFKNISTTPGFELAVRNSQFAKRFGSLRMSFCIFLKIANRENQILHEFPELFIELGL